MGYAEKILSVDFVDLWNKQSNEFSYLLLFFNCKIQYSSGFHESRGRLVGGGRVR